MPPTQKKRRDRRGRPALAASVQKAAESLRRDDGQRLNAAILAMGFKSQAEAARRAGIRQGWLNGIVNGNRAIGREDLRALAAIGISADYILGVAKELIAPGETRAVADLERDVAAHVKRKVFARVIKGAPMWQSFVTYWRTDGAAVLRQAVEREVKAFHDASKELEEFKARGRELLDQRRSNIASAAGIPSSWPKKGTTTEQRRAELLALRKRTDRLLVGLADAYQQAEFARRINESGAALTYDPTWPRPVTGQTATDSPPSNEAKAPIPTPRAKK